MTAGGGLRRHGLTQRELAGITQSVVSAYESGSREPSLATLSALSLGPLGPAWRCTWGRGPSVGFPSGPGRWAAGSAVAERRSWQSRLGTA